MLERCTKADFFIRDRDLFGRRPLEGHKKGPASFNPGNSFCKGSCVYLTTTNLLTVSANNHTSKIFYSRYAKGICYRVRTPLTLADCRDYNC